MCECRGTHPRIAPPLQVSAPHSNNGNVCCFQATRCGAKRGRTTQPAASVVLRWLTNSRFSSCATTASRSHSQMTNIFAKRISTLSFERLHNTRNRPLPRDFSSAQCSAPVIREHGVGGRVSRCYVETIHQNNSTT